MIKDLLYQEGAVSPYKNTMKTDKFREVSEEWRKKFDLPGEGHIDLLGMLHCFMGGDWGGGASHYFMRIGGKLFYTPHINIPCEMVEVPEPCETPEAFAEWFIDASSDPVSNLGFRWTELVE
jgi:hypothetical protein